MIKHLLVLFSLAAFMQSCGKKTKEADLKITSSANGSLDSLEEKMESERYSKLLMSAIQTKDFVLATEALLRGANPNFVSEEGKRPLIEASRTKNTEIVQLLIENNVDINQVDKNLDSALTIAVEKADYYTVNLLLSNNVEINYFDGRGHTALHIALTMNNSHLANTLILAGADISKVNSFGLRAVDIARFYNISETKKLLSDIEKINQKGVEVDHFLDIIASSRLTTLKYLFKYHTLNEEVNGLSVLSKLIEKENIINKYEMIRLLLKNGFSADGEVNDTEVPLVQATKKEDILLLYTLLEFGADPNKIDQLGRTALTYATSKLNTRAVNALIGFGANKEYIFHYENKNYLMKACKFIPSFGIFGRATNENFQKSQEIKSILDC